MKLNSDFKGSHLTCSLFLGKVTGDWKKGSIACIFKKGRKEDSGNYQELSQTPLHAWEDHGTNPPRGYAEASGEQGHDSRHPTQLQQGQVLPKQLSGLV